MDVDMSSARRRTTTIRRSHARDRLLLVLPGVVLLAGLVFMLGHSSAGESRPLEFTNFVTPFAAGDDVGIPDAERRPPSVANGDAFAGDRPAGETAGPPAEVAPGRYLVAIEDEEGRPVADVGVTLFEFGRVAVAAAPDGGTEILEPFAREELVTDAQGVLEFDAGDRGTRFELLVAVEGYARKHYRLRDPGKRSSLKLYRSASISGKVADEDRQPLAGITVELWHDINRRLTTLTDENGHYEFREVTPTTATLRVNDAGYKRARQHVVVVEGRTQYFRDFILERGRHLDVLVIEPDGSPVPAIDVRLIELDSGLVCGATRTDGGGRALFDCLDGARRYLVLARSGGLGGRVIVAPLGEIDRGRAAVVVNPLWTLTGTIRTADGLPLPGTQIVIESQAADGSTSSSKEQFVVATDPDGNFVVPELDPTLDYAALIYHQQFAMQQIAKIEAPEAGAAEGDLTAAPESAADETRMEIVLAPAATLEGIAEDPEGRTLADTVIYLSFEDDLLRSLPGGQISVRTDSEGRFFIGNLGAGLYRLEAHHLASGLSSPHLALDLGTGDSLVRRFVLENR